MMIALRSAAAARNGSRSLSTVWRNAVAPSGPGAGRASVRPAPLGPVRMVQCPHEPIVVGQALGPLGLATAATHAPFAPVLTA
jgi:hypothetical protein